MSAKQPRERWVEVLLIVALLLPVAVMFLLPGAGMMMGAMWFWMFLLLCFFFLAYLFGGGARASQVEERQFRMLPESEYPEPIGRIMEVKLATEQDEVQVFRGRLLESPVAAYETLNQQLPEGTVPLIQEDEEFGASVLLMSRRVEEQVLERPIRPWVHWLLFALALLTTTWAGAAHQGINLLQKPERFAAGLPYALGLMLILGIHELGHYFMAKRHGIHVTPPYFIPVPFALGTFGAFIEMRSPPKGRRALFDVAVAGPLAGLVVAIPALLIGLQSSTVLPGDAPPMSGMRMHGVNVGSSVLFSLLSKAALGETLEYGHVIRLSPLAFAGWLGLLITALNLLPIGQLDGGHMTRAMFGTRAGLTISTVAMWTLLLLAIFVWPGLLMWAIIVFFLAGSPNPPLNDLTPITPARRWVGYATLILLALIISPLPHAVWPAVGIHCPYL